MLVKEYRDANLYLNDHEADLLEREAVSQLILYNAYQNQELLEIGKCIFGVVYDNEYTPILHFSKVSPDNMLICAQSMDKELLIRAGTKLAEYMVDNNIQFSGISAKHEVCQSFIEEYKKSTKCAFLKKLSMDIMEIRSVNDITPVDGTPRFATFDEVKIIADWMVQFQIEARASEINYEDALNKATLLARDNKVYVYENNEQEVVSMAIATRQLRHGVALSYVYTPDEYRGIGYAAANLYYMSREFFNKGFEFCTMFVDKKNLISSRSYEKVGFCAIEDIYEYQLIIE